MAITITHTKVATTPDDPTAEVGTNEWNAAHTVTGSIVGGSDGQFQYNNNGEGAGAVKLIYDDTLNVTKMTADSGLGGGFIANLDNPFCVNDDNYHRGYEFRADWVAPSGTNVGFTTQMTVAIPGRIMEGENLHGGGTNAKCTFTNLGISVDAYGAGQRILTQQTINAYGMGDACLETRRVSFSSGNISGDEGVGFSLVNTLMQAELFVKANITSIPTQATINTTTTQVITGDKDPQTVTVANSSGVVAGQWVVVEQAPSTHLINIEAVQVTAVPNGTSITGIFRANHGLGVKVTPATVLGLAANFMGEQRVVVNLSATPYTTGTVASISGAAFTGSGTTWANNMVGGNADNVGAISLTSDDYTGLPYSTAPNQLKSWYQITSVPSTTQVDIHTTSVAGDAAYRGNGVAVSGAYTIRPAMRILRIPNLSTIVCETSTHTWAVNDIIECAICPYPDMTAFRYHVGAFTPGGTYRNFQAVLNLGSRKIEFGYFLGFYGNPKCDGTNGASTGSWGTCYAAQHCDVAFAHYGTNGYTDAKCSLLLPRGGDNSGGTDQGGAIVWSPTTQNVTARLPQIRPNEGNEGLDIIGTGVAATLTGALRFILHGKGINTSSATTGAELLTFGGQFKVGTSTFANIATAAANLVGTMIVITDSDTATVGATIAGGGANTVMAWCDGANWKVMAA